MKITNLTKKFDALTVQIDNMDLSEKKIYGLIGPNGCGKTTLIKMIAGLLRPDSGVINYEGLLSRDITMIPRKPYLMHGSIIKNLEYPFRIRKKQPDNNLMRFYLQISGFIDRQKEYAPSLSSGEQQKLSLSRGLIFSPHLILIDEALSNLDIESVKTYEDLILQKQKELPAIWIVVSHQLTNIYRLCDYVFFMHKGSILTEGVTEDLLKNPNNPYLKQYLSQEVLQFDKTI